MGGRERLLPALAELDAALSQLYEDHRGKLEIVLYSDHGNTLLPFKRVSMKTHLAGCGFEPSNRVGSRRSVIIPGFGLCSYAPIYSTIENRREIAGALSTLAGVDFSVFRPLDDDANNGGGITELIGPRGRARIHYDPHSNAFRYEQIEGDPLALAEAVRELDKRRSMDGRGYARDDAWFEITRDHIYPDAVRNIWSSVREHVESTADVLVSFEDGYCYGSAVFNRLVSLAATHGSALRSTSYAFLMSTHSDFPAHMRANQARVAIRG
jgi:hypothetical protein